MLIYTISNNKIFFQFFQVKDKYIFKLYQMVIMKKLTKQYIELWKEYEEFLKINKLQESDVIYVYFIYYDRCVNNNCLKYKPGLTQEECRMYNLTVDDDCNCIMTDNGFGTIYIKLKNKTIMGFRATKQCMKPNNHRFVNQWNVTIENLSNNHCELLKGI